MYPWFDTIFIGYLHASGILPGSGRPSPQGNFRKIIRYQTRWIL
ncbi:hypothetical protein HMPREF3293_00913 [Christensenella minuta]|uniref:Uncharacterized protein n=1 Tax=Christensenella minuta TaxID=626937 RepID=A0A136Q680_9FIRM|nr:hypothetical protein HMPREF3293_00913 [Christensenella minuta]